MRKISALIIALCLTASLCGCGNATKEATTTTTTEKMDTADNVSDTTSATASVVTAEMTSAEICESMQKTLHEYFSENTLVEYVEANDIYQISYWIDGATALSLAAEDGNDTAREDWDSLVERMKKLSLDSKDSLAKYAPNASVSAVVVNENDHSKILLAALDGEVILDVVYGIGFKTDE